MHLANALLLEHQALEEHLQRIVTSFGEPCHAVQQACEASALLQQPTAWQY